MKRSLLFLVALIFLLAGCGPSQAEIDKQIQEAIHNTQVAGIVAETENVPEIKATPTKRPTRTKAPTNTPAPTRTPRPTATPTATRSPEEFKQEMSSAVVDLLESIEFIENVNMVRYSEDGSLEIEIKLIWASQDRQMDSHYTLIQVLADTFAKYSEERMNELSGGSHFGISLTTISTDGDYRLQSYTDFPTLVQLKAKAISVDEWIQLSNASFR